MELPAAANERTGRRPIRWPPERLPLHSRSFRSSRSLSPYRHNDEDNDDAANGRALSRPAGEGGVSGGELSLVNATALTTHAEEPTALSRPRWNAPPIERGSEANIPLPFNRSEDCDYGAVMQKLRTMDHPEMIAYVEAEYARAELANSLVRVRMACYACQEGIRRNHNWVHSGVLCDGPIFHASDETLPLWAANRTGRLGPHLNQPRQDHGAAYQDPGISPAPAPGPTPDQVELAKCRRALAAAKRALLDIHEPLVEFSSPEDFCANARARAEYGLAEIAEALEGEAL